MTGRLTRFSVLTLCLVFAGVSEAQQLERILIPIAIGGAGLPGVHGIPGAFGSEWVSDAWASNPSTVIRHFETHTFCITECPPPSILPDQRLHIILFGEPAIAPGLIVYVEKGDAPVTFNIRAQDVSRQSQTWGTEIPAVRENEFVSTAVRLLDVPPDSRFRITLRVYALDAPDDARVLVTLLPDFGSPLGSTELTLQQSSNTASTLKYKPFYVQLDDLAGVFPSVRGVQQFHVDVAPISSSMKIWTFISVTNNETQHVTVITPH